METDDYFSIPKNRMLCIILNAARIAQRKYTRDPLWVLVEQVTGYGSTKSIELCKTLGMDPHSKASRPTMR